MISWSAPAVSQSTTAAPAAASTGPSYTMASDSTTSTVVGQVARYMQFSTSTGSSRPLSAVVETRTLGVADLISDVTIADVNIFNDVQNSYDSLMSFRAHVLPGCRHEPVQISLADMVTSAPTAANAVQFSSDYASLAGMGDASSPLGMTLLQCTTLLSQRTALQYGNPLNGASSVWAFPVAKAVMGIHTPGFSAAGHVPCMKFVSNFVHWLTRTCVLPTVSAMFTSGMLTGGMVPEALPADRLCEFIKALHTEVTQRCIVLIDHLHVRLQHKPAVSVQDSSTARDFMTRFSATYLDWRYLHAPILAQGAACLLAYLLSSEPVVYRGLLLDNTRSKGMGLMGGRKTHQQPCTIKQVQMTKCLRPYNVAGQEDYVRLHYVIRVATQYDVTAVYMNIADDVRHDPERLAAYIAHLIIERNIYCACVAVQFASFSNSRIGVVDNMRFFTYIAPDSFLLSTDFIALVQTLSRARFGRVITKDVPGGGIHRSLLPPYRHEFVYDDLPTSVIYSEDSICQFGDELFQSMWDNQPRSFNTQIDHVLNANKTNDSRLRIMCRVGQCPIPIYPLAMNRVGQRSLAAHFKAKMAARTADTESNGNGEDAAAVSSSSSSSSSSSAQGTIRHLDPIEAIKNPPLGLDSSQSVPVNPVPRTPGQIETVVTTIRATEQLAAHLLEIISSHGVLSSGRIVAKKTTSMRMRNPSVSKRKAVQDNTVVVVDQVQDDGDDSDVILLSHRSKPAAVSSSSSSSSSSAAAAAAAAVANGQLININIFSVRSIVAMIIYYTRFCNQAEFVSISCPSHDFTELCSMISKKANPGSPGRAFFNIYTNSPLLPLLRLAENVPSIANVICRNSLPFLHVKNGIRIQ